MKNNTNQLFKKIASMPLPSIYFKLSHSATLVLQRKAKKQKGPQRLKTANLLSKNFITRRDICSMSMACFLTYHSLQPRVLTQRGLEAVKCIKSRCFFVCLLFHRGMDHTR